MVIPGQARVNPLCALARLAAALPHIATRTAARGVTVGHGRVNEVATTAGTITPGAVVFATGTPPRIEGLSMDVPFDTVKGHLLVTEPTPVRLPGSVAAVATQLEDGRLLVGGTLDAEDQSPGVRSEVVDLMRVELSAALPALGSRFGVTHSWCCFRPHHPDGLPVIDRVPGLANAWVTSGHYRTGILMGPAAATVLAEWISTGRQPARARPWAMARFNDGRKVSAMI